ncbi:hydantoinase B/oxoprolinase family protein [Natrarchaeobius chitinivorans]|uniref:Hydantoinase B/oxoprolinase family protein n=1 Tax=Natrarchaeobius chitinivorans TaxID=1679083 RepID=A0A3N6MCD7_NATCH|nr:hydantoinase B/oxoprolinase family protein [Natrarchaeobius chitinivorans]RQG94190.1 hydantoinase B/oxoprolinase family protein [Natrarchaeobius chitinivorans]
METDRETPAIDEYLLTVLSKKFESVTRDMTHSLLRSARSGVISVARDFSSAITLYDGRQFMIDEGIPVHVGNIGLVPEHTIDCFDDVAEGDCFLTNSPFYGNSHHADFTLHAPVFHDGEPLFWSINRAHQADVGAPEPSTYLPEGAEVYDEGLHFPSVRIQEDYEDRDDIVRMCKQNIRLGEQQWYGDYRAQVAAVRSGERTIQEIIDEYGIDVITEFIDAWLSYGETMMRAEISELPSAESEYTSYHDPLPGAPDGVPITVSFEIDADAERIDVDISDNIDTLPCGFNLCEATSVAAIYSGIFNSIDSKVPHNHGSLGRIHVEMGEGNVVGKPEYPTGTSVATTNICDALFNAVHGALGKIGSNIGCAEGNVGMGAYGASIAGTDFRRDGAEYVNQILFTSGGGPGVPGHDGWLTYGSPDAGGVLRRDSIEIDEMKHPILFERNEVRQDTEGPGQWRGSPGIVIEYGPREDPMTITYLSGGTEFRPQGIRGGKPGALETTEKRTEAGDLVELSPIGTETIAPGETIVGRKSGGGGYGDPYDRNRHSVLKDVRRDIVSVTRAREEYGVVLVETEDGYAIDSDATNDRRGRTNRRDATSETEGEPDDN